VKDKILVSAAVCLILATTAAVGLLPFFALGLAVSSLGNEQATEFAFWGVLSIPFICLAILWAIFLWVANRVWWRKHQGS
jgi:hypothetical protein